MKNITIKLMDCYDKKSKFIIKDIDNILFAKYELYSGDETLTVYYKNNKVVFYDSCTSIRLESWHENEVLLNKEQLKIFNRLHGKDTYDRAEKLEKIDKWDFEVIGSDENEFI